MPLLLSLYHLTPPAKVSRREEIKWIVIEEPEMGLHPQAIQTVMLLCLELLSRDYCIAITTHSPVFLELAWAIRHIPADQAHTLF
ncbi:MAG: ATP-binding protein [Saprospiraceae bacterium]|nr:ATP-binding protein [Saprospiraceae bacterium]MDW8483602.1 AAA family ATPase [Saprospiraceae bacterium]